MVSGLQIAENGARGRLEGKNYTGGQRRREKVSVRKKTMALSRDPVIALEREGKVQSR